MNMRQRRRGFTLLEVLVAAIIGAFVAMTAVAAMRTVVAGRDRTYKAIDSSNKLRFACNLIKNDCGNLYIDTQKNAVKLVGEFLELQDTGKIVHSLTMHIVSRTKARIGSPESDVYEVQYYLLFDEDEQSYMFLRRFCPKIAGASADPDYGTGGILTIIAKDITTFSVLYYDGQEWLAEWTGQQRQLPQILDVTIASRGVDEKTQISKSFLVDLSKISSQINQVSNEEDTTNN